MLTYSTKTKEKFDKYDYEIVGSGKALETKEPEKTTLDDNSICLFCNIKNENLKQNIIHMVQKHKLDIPFIFYIDFF